MLYYSLTLHSLSGCDPCAKALGTLFVRILTVFPSKLMLITFIAYAHVLKPILQVYSFACQMPSETAILN